MADISKAVNVATMADAGFFPFAGGILDQSAWFIDLWTALRNDQARLDAKRIKDAYK